MIETFNSYQKFTQALAVYNTDVELYTSIGAMGFPITFLYPTLALAEEAGEVAGKVAKFVRKSRGSLPDYEALRMDVLKELGDVAYQLSETARQFGWTLQEVINANISKLEDRQDRGVLIGEGDER